MKMVNVYLAYKFTRNYMLDTPVHYSSEITIKIMLNIPNMIHFNFFFEYVLLFY